MPKPLNINGHVWVKLNQIGLKRLEDVHVKYVTENNITPSDSRWNYYPPETDVNGYTRYTVWDLMSLFGDCMKMGVLPPFDGDIIIEREDDK